MSFQHELAPAGRAAMKTSAALLSVGVNVTLLVLKGSVALFTGSVALWASFIDSLQDLAASLFALLGVRLGSKPPDATHAYGHTRFESLSSLGQLTLLFVTVGLVTWEAVNRLQTGGTVSAPMAGIAVIVVAMVLDVWVARRLKRAATAAGGSHALEADALHFTTDVWSNLAVIAGLVAVALGFPVGDPVAALVVAALVAITATSLLRRTAGGLTDRAPDEQTVRRIAETIGSFPGVRDFHTLRARLVGTHIYLDVCVELDPGLSFQRAHDLSHEMQEALHRRIPALTDAVIHFEPAGHPPHQDHAHHSHGRDALALDDLP